MSTNKFFITPESLRIDSYKLAGLVVKSGFVPDYIVVIWRGGAPVGCYVHELMKRVGLNPDHIAIRTARYTGIDKTSSEIQVFNLGYLLERLKKESKVLLIDDVYDTGLTIQKIKQTFSEKLGNNCPDDIRTATVYYKPLRNKTAHIPEYYVKTSDQWLVFPHELEGLSIDEISELISPEIGQLVSELTN